jgi:poly(hydroxyalkanoate) depolymerase family esterase
MNTDFATAMGRALELTRAGDPDAATRCIQAALAGAPFEPPAPAASRSPETHAERLRVRGADVEDAEIVEDDAPHARPHPEHAFPWPGQPAAGSGRHLKDVVATLRKLRVQMPDLGPLQGRGTPPPIPEGARWETRSFASAQGTRDYRLYVPASLDRASKQGAPNGLVLMLHGCTQNPDDFATGTAMNVQAERHGLIVVYPHQSRSHNAQGCWNWFRPSDQQAHAGEPAILAGLTRDVAAEFSVAPDHIFVAGLSAGGAMAATLGATHPELFSAIGVHSGLPHGAAQDVVSAFAAMRGERSGLAKPSSAVRTIVFHGTADAVVHPSNAEAILMSASGQRGALRRETGVSAGGRSYAREWQEGEDGTRHAELWRIEGAGHAWSGGKPEGSYTDPVGPDASAEMARFFLKLDTENRS